MTDTEIIKALKEEIRLAEYVYDFFADNVSVELLKNALDLINRQKEEIETWKESFNNLDKIARPSVEYVKSEKIKTVDEFARRLIEEINTINYKEYNNYLDTFNTIERVAEEMEREENESK